jgi:hypothetical protein
MYWAKQYEIIALEAILRQNIKYPHELTFFATGQTILMWLLGSCLHKKFCYITA